MIHVTAAILRNEQGEYLLCKRGPGRKNEGLWEFPGGKLEPGETLEQCLIRECLEELKIRIAVERDYDTEYPPGTDLALHFFLCHIEEGIPTPTEHSAICWCPPKSLTEYTFCPADTACVQKLIKE